MPWYAMFFISVMIVETICGEASIAKSNVAFLNRFNACNGWANQSNCQHRKSLKGSLNINSD